MRIAYIGGGSLNFAPTLMSDLALEPRLDAELRLFDLDAAAAKRNAVIGTRLASRHLGRPARYVVSRTMKDALKGADIVLVSIQPGSFNEMAKDIGIPACYGIPHVVGESAGPAGFFRALRGIPTMIEIGRAIGEFAPKAFVCNMTNPLSTLTDALYAGFPQIRAWGSCTEVTHLRHLIAGLANRDEPDAPAWTFRDVQVSISGINHFTFADRISLEGRDMVPAYAEFARKANPKGEHSTSPALDKALYRHFQSRGLVGFDVFRRFGVPVAVNDRHLAEHFPAQDYLNDAQRWGVSLTPISSRRRNRVKQIATANARAKGLERIPLMRSDGLLVDKICALIADEPIVTNVNLPNRGQMPGLPMGSIVETNAQFSAMGITPLVAGRLPIGLEAMARDHANRHSQLVRAVVRGDSSAMFPLFYSDPLVAPLSQDKARRMFLEMMAALRRFLPQQLRGAA